MVRDVAPRILAMTSLSVTSTSTRLDLIVLSAKRPPTSRHGGLLRFGPRRCRYLRQSPSRHPSPRPHKAGPSVLGTSEVRISLYLWVWYLLCLIPLRRFKCPGHSDIHRPTSSWFDTFDLIPTNRRQVPIRLAPIYVDHPSVCEVRSDFLHTTCSDHLFLDLHWDRFDSLAISGHLSCRNPSFDTNRDESRCVPQLKICSAKNAPPPLVLAFNSPIDHDFHPTGFYVLPLCLHSHYFLFCSS